MKTGKQAIYHVHFLTKVKQKIKLSEGSAICSCFELEKIMTKAVIMQSFRGSIYLEFSSIDLE